MKNPIIKFVVFTQSLFIINFSFSQAPAIEWQNNIGGVSLDYLYKIIQSNDGGYVLLGNSYSSISGDKTESSNGLTDYWILKLDPVGNIIWQNTIGGDDLDTPTEIIQCSDNGYLICGYSLSSASGDKTESVIGGTGEYDIWIVKLDPEGEIEWENTIGSDGEDFVYDVVNAHDGGFIIGGSSNGGISGDKNMVSLGSDDYWILKISDLGIIQWQKRIGGFDSDVINSIEATTDNCYIILGSSYSGIGGDKTEPNPGIWDSDLWVLKIDLYGDIIWQNTIIANKNDQGVSIHQTSDNGYIIGSTTYSDAAFDKSENHYGGDGKNDFWIIKLNESGDIEWDNNIGGLDYDYCKNAIQTDDGGYLVGGKTTGAGGDKIGYIFSYDYWILKLGVDGSIIWQDVLGGNGADYMEGFTETSDGGFILAGYSNSQISWDHNEYNIGSLDYWAVKLYPDCVVETCNALDDNCNGLIDDAIVETINISAGSPIIFCQGGNVLLTATYSGTSVQWKKNGINITGATSSTYSVIKTGDYTCVTTSPCGTATSSIIHVIVNKNPAASISAAGATTFCAGGSVTLNEVPVTGSSYQWFKGASAIAGATFTNYIATTAGNYKCRVTKTASGCFKNSNTIVVTVPCKEGEELMNEENNNFTIFPNPNTGTFNLVYNVPTGATSPYGGPWGPISPLKGGPMGVTTLEIFNSLGQQIHSQQINSCDGNINETISINNLSSGIYYIRMRTNDIHYEKKLIIE